MEVVTGLASRINEFGLIVVKIFELSVWCAVYVLKKRELIGVYIIERSTTFRNLLETYL